MVITTNLTFGNTDNAEFRAWGLAIHNGIIAGGWANTADTGQIDFATVLAPAAPSTSQGYKMYRSSDAGSGQNNYYVKIEFGSYIGAATSPSIWVTIGWETDGAGNLVSATYPITTRQQVAEGGTFATSLDVAAGSGANGAGYIVFTASSASRCLAVSIERTRNTDLTFKNEVMFIGYGPSGSQAAPRVINRINVFNSSNVMGIIPPNANTPIAGKAGLGLIFGAAPGLTSPSMNLFGVERLAVGVARNSLIVSILGENHVYKHLDNGATFQNIASTNMLARYE